MRHVWCIETVDHAEPIAEHICQADAHQRVAVMFCIFDYTAADWRFFDHGGKFEHIHVCHAAVGVPAVEIGAEQIVLRFGRPRRGGASIKVCIAILGAPLAFAGPKGGHVDPRRQAGRTFRTGGSVQHVLRAPEPLLAETVVQFVGVVALQGSEQLSFHPALKIGAGLWRSHVELRSKWKSMAHVHPEWIASDDSKAARRGKSVTPACQSDARFAVQGGRAHHVIRQPLTSV